MKRFSSSRCYADITPNERAIANGQRSFVSFLLLHLSKSFLRILAVPNKAVFCNSPVLIVTPSLSSHASNLFAYYYECPNDSGTYYYYYHYYYYYYYYNYYYYYSYYNYYYNYYYYYYYYCYYLDKKRTS